VNRIYPAPITSEVVDERSAKIERLEIDLAREREAMKNERESITFERESLELQLDKEAQKREYLNQQLRTLKLKEQKYVTGAADKACELTGLSGENEGLKREQRESEQRMIEMETEIKHLKSTINNLKMEEKFEVFSVNLTDERSRQSLQGELLQTISKVLDRDATISRQNKEIMILELVMLRLCELIA
jgi:chromosome segregation ATPase